MPVRASKLQCTTVYSFLLHKMVLYTIVSHSCCGCVFSSDWSIRQRWKFCSCWYSVPSGSN